MEPTLNSAALVPLSMEEIQQVLGLLDILVGIELICWEENHES